MGVTEFDAGAQRHPKEGCGGGCRHDDNGAKPIEDACKISCGHRGNLTHPYGKHPGCAPAKNRDGTMVLTGRGRAMARQSDLLWVAAVCRRLMVLSVDPKEKQRFKQLRDAWIALAHEGPDLRGETIGETIAAFVACQDGSIH